MNIDTLLLAALRPLADGIMESTIRGALIGGAIGAVVGVIMWAAKRGKNNDKGGPGPRP